MPKNSLAVVGHIGPVSDGDKISPPHALAALAALGQPTRLEIFRLLIRASPRALPPAPSRRRLARRTTRSRRTSRSSPAPAW